ncbi:MAG: ferritin-like protein [Bryobacterales bacterium]|nr:ferritin-like protein [Bryobacterales bacterium]
MDIEHFEELYVLQLQQLVDVERMLIESLPVMADAAHSADLGAALLVHLAQTKAQAKRLEGILTAMGEDATGIECEAMQGLIGEAEDIVESFDESPLRDFALIGAGEKVEHFEIAAYGTARSLARFLGRQDAVMLLEETLDEEKEADKKLTELAGTVVNPAEFSQEVEGS